eukprot:1159483-Pelagomonas_calceolata.AAC.18
MPFIALSAHATQRKGMGTCPSICVRVCIDSCVPASSWARLQAVLCCTTRTLAMSIAFDTQPHELEAHSVLFALKYPRELAGHSAGDPVKWSRELHCGLGDKKGWIYARHNRLVVSTKEC